MFKREASNLINYFGRHVLKLDLYYYGIYSNIHFECNKHCFAL